MENLRCQKSKIEIKKKYSETRILMGNEIMYVYFSDSVRMNRTYGVSLIHVALAFFVSLSV